MSVFVDTSVWYAAVDAGDLDHQRAKRILQSESRLVTTDLVLTETWRLIRSRLGYRTAEVFWSRVRGLVRIEQVTPDDFDAAYRIGKAFEDQEFSLVDRTSFALMERLSLSRAAALDSDFLVFRYGPRRRNAFTVLP